MDNVITVWEAIKQMRDISANGGEFSMVFMSLSQSRKSSHGAVRVDRCRLRKGTTKENNRYADHMLNFLDLTSNRPSQMYQPLLMEFNGKRTILV